MAYIWCWRLKVRGKLDGLTWIKSAATKELFRFLLKKNELSFSDISFQMYLIRFKKWSNGKLKNEVMAKSVSELSELGHFIWGWLFITVLNPEPQNLYVSRGPLPVFETISGIWKPFQNNEKCFLFHLKSSFRS